MVLSAKVRRNDRLLQILKIGNTFRPMTGINLQMDWLSLRNNWLEFKTTGEILIILEKFVVYTQINEGKLKDVNM